MDLQSMRRFAEKYTVDSNEAIEFKLVRRKEDLENDSTSFKPEMSHQIYGEGEKIFGYKDLSIKIYYTAGHLNTYVGTEYTAKVDQKKFDVKADNLMKPLSNVLPPGSTTSLDEFCSVLEKEGPFKPMGELLNVFSTNDKDGSLRNFEVYSGDVDTEGLKRYHERIQTFILFFIDAASFLDVDDNKWRFFFV